MTSPLNARISKMLDEDPERAARLLVSALPIAAQRDELLRRLREEKGENHAILARQLMGTAAAIGMLAAITGGLESGQIATSDAETWIKGVVDMLGNTSARLAKELGVSQADFDELTDACTAMQDAVIGAARESKKSTP